MILFQKVSVEPCCATQKVVGLCMQINNFTFISEFKDLFPDRNLSDELLTVITISQKTVNDMSTWSEVVVQEREELTDFVRLVF